MLNVRGVRRAALGVMLVVSGAVFGARAEAQAPPDYTMNAGDQLDISVWKEPDLTKTVIIRPDGKFSFPLVGEVNAAGRTIVQIQNDVAARLKTYIPDPVVTASVHGLDGFRIYVIGQVTKPGAYVMNPRMNVLQALTTAGGMTPFAAVNDVIVLRGAAGAGQRMLRFQFGEVSRGRNLEQNVMLEAGDVVIVP